jgi:hypothetical protein
MSPHTVAAFIEKLQKNKDLSSFDEGSATPPAQQLLWLFIRAQVLDNARPAGSKINYV